MIVVGHTTKQQSQSKGNSNRAQQILSAYTKSPDVEFSIDEFESYAISRLNVLRWIEKQTVSGRAVTDVTEILRSNNLHIPQNDEISHFIGRLCFCQTLERRRWFLNTEKILFEARYKVAGAEQKKRIHFELCHGYSEYDIITKSHIITNELINGQNPIPFFKKGVSLHNESDILPFYKVPFTEVLSLIGRRSVYLMDGFAFVPNNKFFSIITGKFRAHLNRGLSSAQKAIEKMKCDPITSDTINRISHIIDGLYQITNGPQYKVKKNINKLDAKSINKLASVHYPLCMQSSIEHLRMDGHLKHGGRMHLGLFLKGIGVSLQESLVYWRHSFTKIGGEKFNKQYSYNVRHNYGKEGKRIDYTPYSCNKIIGCTPNNGDFHGCPFKIFDSTNLKQYLSLNKKLNSSDVSVILDLIKDNHYQLGCRHFFSAQHKDILKKKRVLIEEISSQWSHPNEYFEQSWMLYHGSSEEEKKEDNGMDIDKENNNNTNNGNVTHGMNVD